MMAQRWFKLIGLAGLVLLVALWFVLFFFPSTVELNHLKREARDLGDQIKGNMNAGEAFEFPDTLELGRFQTTETQLQTELPRIEHADGLFRLITQVSGFLKEAAAAEGLGNLIVSSNSKDLEINAQALPQTGRDLEELLMFSSSRLREIQVQADRGAALPQSAGPFGLASHTLFMTFAGDLKAALSFLHRLPSLNRALRVEKLVLSEGRENPLFLVLVRLHFWDVRARSAAQVDPDSEETHAQE
jgi:hypothetical protein